MDLAAELARIEEAELYLEELFLPLLEATLNTDTD